MENSKEFFDFIEKFKKDKYHRSYSMKDYDLWSYSTNKGKFGFSNILCGILRNDFSNVEVKLFISMLGEVDQTREFEKSGIVDCRYDPYSDVCSHVTFYNALRKYAEYKLLIPTPEKRYYILNPLYINKFFKEKVEKDKNQKQ